MDEWNEMDGILERAELDGILERTGMNDWDTWMG